jgi:AraC family transcriptional regulator
MIEAWELVPHIYYHIYVEKADRFMLDQARYDDWILFIVEDGSFAFEFDHTKGVASNGDLVICPPEHVFHRRALTSLSFHFIIFAWSSIIAEAKAVYSQIPIGKFHLRDSQRLLSTLSLLRSLSGRQDTLSIHRKNHLLADLWLSYLSNELEMAPDTDDPLMNQALRIIRQQVLGKLNLKTIAKELQLSPAQLTQKFTHRFGKNPMAYVTEQRLQKAQTLLRETSLTLAAIASRCGYDNEYYLSRIFKRKIGMTPSQYRHISRL